LLDDEGEPEGSARPLLRRYLDALDTYVRETTQVPSNGVIVAVLFAPLLERVLRDATRSELDALVDDTMTPPCAQLGVARRDRELARQIFMAHRRMLQPTQRRGQPNLVQRQYFHDALLFLGFSVGAGMGDAGELARWHDLARRKSTAPDEPEPARKRSRRRRRRRGPKPDRSSQAAAAND
jgi:poly(A) polymerase